MKAVRSLLAAVGLLALGACGGGSVQAPDFESALDSLNLSVPAGETSSPALGQTVQLALVGHYTCQPSVPCPSTDTLPVATATYTATPASRATVDNTGLVTTKEPGTVTITASSKSGIKSNTVTLQIGPPSVTRVEIHIPDNTGAATGSALSNVQIPVGGTKAVKVYAVYSNSPTLQDLGENDSVLWTISPDTTVADFTPNNKALTTIKAKAFGTPPTITATVTLGAGGTKTAQLTVTVGGAVLTGIQTALNPATASIATGFKQQFQVIGTYSDNTTAPIDPSLVTWTVVDPTTNAADATVATVDATGLATGVYSGSALSANAKIVATLNSDNTKKASAVLTVLGSSALGCSELFTNTATVTPNISFLCDPLGNLLGLSLPLCGVVNKNPDNSAVDNLVDLDPTSYIQMFSTVGVLFQSYVSVVVKAPTAFPASSGALRYPGFIIGNPVAQLVKADIGAAFSVSTLLNGVVQQTTDNGIFFTLPGQTQPAFYAPGSSSINVSPDALTIDLLGLRLSGDDAALLSIKANKPFDAVVLTYNAGLLGVNSKRNVLGACANSINSASTP